MFGMRYLDGINDGNSSCLSIVVKVSRLDHRPMWMVFLIARLGSRCILNILYFLLGFTLYLLFEKCMYL